MLLAGVTIARGVWNATRDPIIRRATITLDGWPADAPPLTVLHLSDIHVAGPDMPPERLARLVQGFNRLRPDLVTIAGDLISEKRTATRHYSAAQTIAPLGGLRAPLGVVVVPGNHDHWFDIAVIRRELDRNGLTVLANSAVVRGPLVIGGVDDDFSGHDDVPATRRAVAAAGAGVEVLLTHSPDIVAELERPAALILAGHTHCGQIRLPIIGAISYVSRYGDRFACGLIRDANGTVVVGAGLGTSVLQLRYGAPPDAWLLTLRGRTAR